MNKTNPALPPLACVILAAGQGTRMKSDLPKVMHPIAGVPMIRHVLNACAELLPQQIITVIAPDHASIADTIKPSLSAIQKTAQGTGDAVKAARPSLDKFTGDILVLFGDTPLIEADTLRQLLARKAETKAAIVVAGFEIADPAAYGRLVMDQTGNLLEIVETKDATAEQRQITLCNGGIMLFEGAKLWPLLAQLTNNNAKQEYYLTDCVKLARAQGLTVSVARIAADQVLGVNNRVELATAEQLMQRRLRERAMVNGATLLDPNTVYLAADTRIGRDVVIGPHVVIGTGVEIQDKAVIKAFCHLEQAVVQSGAIIGPYARLRPGSVVGREAHIGNFVELKNTQVGEKAKINHLSYIGDSTVGARANIGAGTITCNYDGFRKSRTEIGAEAFVGSNSALVAPVKIGAGSYVGAGSVITMDVPDNTLAVARGRQQNILDWAARYRDQQTQAAADKIK
jgi:bifunctional UDP-N-acetylglucosamine pyrophosphorylase/glucosamine-1-phosphate N-acetyltransferase